MKQIYLFISLMLIAFASCAQVIESDPEFPAYNTKDVTITFHADKGSAGLKGYTGDVYVHTAVIMKNSTDWQHVKADWSTNLDECKMTRTATNTYTITLSSIQEFYGLTEAEAVNVDKLAFVFRSSDGKKEGKETGGKDIFQQVYEPNSLSIIVVSPTQNPCFVDAGQAIDIQISTSEPCDITCDAGEIVDGKYSTTAEESGIHTLTFTANNGATSSSVTFTYIVRCEAETALMPENLLRGVNKTGNNQATFVLYAPNKKSAYVIGDFNNWTINSESVMKKDGDYFFCQIENLDPDMEYAYQYIIDETIRIADPYTEKVLDPDNDKYIPESIYPGLTYPTGKTTGLLSTFRLNRQQYKWTEFVAPKSDDLVIYELLIRDFATEGSIKAVTEKLDYLQQLGINAIELLPFSEFEGNDSWGYNPSFYFAADKAYGTPNDYKDFIEECHQRGIAVIQDVVLNHSFSQSPFVQMYLGSNGKVTSNNPWYNVSSPNTSYSWGYDFNHESLDTKQLVDSVMSYWIKEYNVDGFRFDFTKGFTNTKGDGNAYDASRIAILERIYDKIKSLKSDAYMICEHLTEAKEEKELAQYGIMLWGNVNYAFCQSTMGYSSGSNTNSILASSVGYPNNNLVAYAESHDEERMMFKCLNYGAENANTNYSVKDFETSIDRMKGAAAILLSTPGPKMIWQFGELGYEYSINYNPVTQKEDEDSRTAKKPVPDYFVSPNTNKNIARKELFDFYALMNNLRKTNDAMINGTAEALTNGLQKIVYRSSDNANLIFVVNFDVEKKEIAVNFSKTGTWYDILTGKEINVGSNKQNVTLEAGGVMIISDSENDVVTATEIVNPTLVELNIYPNPVSDICHISAIENISDLQVFSLTGQLLKTEKNIADKEFDLQLQNLTAGMYIVKMKVGKLLVSKKIIKR